MSAPSIAAYFPFDRVVPVHQTLEGVGPWTRAVIDFAPQAGVPPICSACGRAAAPVHSYRRRRVRDLPLCQARVEIMLPHRKVRCSDCGIRIEGYDFLAPYRRTTRRLEAAVADLCRVLPIEHVAAHYGLDWHTVKQIDKRRLEREVGTPCYDGLRLLAIDEISIHKGHRYMTSVLDLESGRIVWIGHGRTVATLLAFFAELTPAQRATIEAIALDMAGAYHEALRRACPQAAVVCDLFHVVAKYSREVIDRVRVDEANQHTGRQRRWIKGSRYLLLRNEADLAGDQHARLAELLAANEALNTVYILKDQLKAIWRYRHPGWARRAVRRWCELAQASGIAPLQAFARNLLPYQAAIVNHCRYPLHTGRLEGMHNKIKVIKRQAYGFRDDDYFILKIKGAFPGRLHPNPR